MLRILSCIISGSAFVISLAYTVVLINEIELLRLFQGNTVYLHLLLSSLLVLIFAGFLVFFLRNDRRSIIISRTALVLFTILQIYKISLWSINTEDLMISLLSFCMLMACSLSTQKHFKIKGLLATNYGNMH